MQSVIVLKGCPGSGKSVYAKELVTTKLYRRINNDDLRRCFHFSEWSKEKEQLIKESTDLLLKEFLKSGHDVVIDNVHAGHHAFDRYSRIVGMLNIDCVIEEHPIYVDLETAIAQDKTRVYSSPVGEKVVKDWWKKLGGESFKNYKPRRLEFKKMEPVVVDPSLPSCIIVDIDGTVADCTGVRSPYDGSKVHLDKPIKTIIELVKSIERDKLATHIVFCSGREDCHWQSTSEWLLKYVGHAWDALLMRKTGDSRPDYIVKREILETCIIPNYYPKFVLDDRDQVVQMWRNSGLTCLQAREGSF